MKCKKDACRLKHKMINCFSSTSVPLGNKSLSADKQNHEIEQPSTFLNATRPSPHRHVYALLELQTIGKHHSFATKLTRFGQDGGFHDSNLKKVMGSLADSISSTMFDSSKTSLFF